MTKTSTRTSTRRKKVVKPKLTPKYWAIPIGDHVELRSNPTPPIKVISSISKFEEAQRRKYNRNPDGSMFITSEPYKKCTSFKQISYVGGEVLGIVRKSDAAVRLYVPPQTRVETNKETVDYLLKTYATW